MEHLGQFITNHWPLWLGLVSVLFLIFINELFLQKKKIGELPPQALIDLINTDQAVILDLRDEESFKNGHIIGSMNLKASDLNPKKMVKYKNKTLVWVCANGLQSLKTAATMRAQGYSSYVLSGGIATWNNQDMPLVKGKN